VDAYTKAIEIDPKNVTGYFSRGQLKLIAGPYTDVIRDANKCIELNPEKEYDYIKLRFSARGFAGMYEEAEADANYLIKLKPDAFSYQLRGGLYMRTEQFKKAHDDFLKCIALSKPAWLWTKEIDLAEAKNKLNMPLEGLLPRLMDSCEFYVKRSPKSIGFRLWMAQLLTIQKNYQRAIDEYSVLIENAKTSLIYQHRGRVYKLIGENQKAWNDFKTASELDPYEYSVRMDLRSIEQILLTAGTSTTDKPETKRNLKGKRIALVIGNKNYLHVPPLANTENDARDMAATLKQKGFQVISLFNAQTKAEIREAVIKFNTALQDATEGVGLFYYSGHGMQIDGENYIIPVNANLAIKPDVEDQCFKVDYILRSMEVSTNKLSIVILDACRNNPFRSFSRSGEVGLTTIDAPKGSYLVFATKPGSTASDGTGKNGLFTSKLLKFINEPGLNLEQVFKKVALEVSVDSKDMQRPWISSDFTDEFYFSNY